MKNLFRIFAGVALIASFASCDNLNEVPVFDEKDAFVAMDISSVAVDENKGTVTIPVTIASINPMNTTVSYEVVDSTAKKGVNYNLTDESAVLVFDGQSRTMNIVLNVIDRPGVADGDLIFTVNIVAAGNSLNLGANVSCTVKISDLDHPLADILGTYTVKQTDVGGDVEYAMTISKDDKDPTVVWIAPICPFLTTNNIPMKVYGNVSEDHKTISIPCGQVYEDFVIFVEMIHQGGTSFKVKDSGNVVMTSTTPGVFTTEQGFGLIVDGGLYYGAAIIQGTTVWTKN